MAKHHRGTPQKLDNHPITRRPLIIYLFFNVFFSYRYTIKIKRQNGFSCVVVLEAVARFSVLRGLQVFLVCEPNILHKNKTFLNSLTRVGLTFRREGKNVTGGILIENSELLVRGSAMIHLLRSALCLSMLVIAVAAKSSNVCDSKCHCLEYESNYLIVNCNGYKEPDFKIDFELFEWPKTENRLIQAFFNNMSIHLLPK